MNEIKYEFTTDYGKFEMVEKAKFDKNKAYPLFLSKKLKTIESEGNEVQILSYPLPVLKTKSKELIEKLKHIWDEGYKDFLSDIDGASNYSNLYEYKGEYYLVLRNSEFKIQDECNLVLFEKGINSFEELGTMEITDKIAEDILELDQNLQSCGSIDLILELMEENTDMRKYINFIKKNIKEEDMDKCFFFDEYIYQLFSQKYMEVLNDVACYKHDGYGLKGIERFVNFAMKGEYHDECKCCNV